MTSANAKSAHMRRRLAARLRRDARHTRQLLQRSVSEFLEDNGLQTAASVSYFGLFSLFPLAILTVTVYGLFLGDAEARERVVGFVLDLVPLDRVEGSRDLREALTSVTRNATAFGIVGIGTLVFSASGLMGAIRGAVDAAWETSEERPFLSGKLLDILLVLGLGLVIALSIALTFLSRLAVSAGEEVERLLGLGGSPLPPVLIALGQLTPVLVSFAVFAFLYRVLPAAEVRLRDVWPGALLAALGFELVKAGFSFYLENLARFGAVYGPLATAVALLVFVFLAANVMVLGAEAASEWRAVRNGEEDAGEESGPREPLRRRASRLARGLVRRD